MLICFHPLYRGTWFPTRTMGRNLADFEAGFHPLYRGTWFPTGGGNGITDADNMFPSAISRYLVSNLQSGSTCSMVGPGGFHPLYRGTWFPTPIHIAESTHPHAFPSAISRYLVSNPTRKTLPLTSGGGKDLHTPRRIDHIPTFASLNHNKNTRSTHYTPNAGIEFSQAGFAPPGISPGHVT